MQFQAAYLSFQYIENSPSGTIVVAMDPNDLEEPVLMRDYYKVARANFNVSAPREVSFPSITNITIDWQLIQQAIDVGEEEILYYSLEWDQGPIREWKELTTPGFIVNNHTLYSGFESSNTYNFRIRALDKIGWGPYSEVLTVIPKALPDQAEVPTTVNDGPRIKISWSKPFGNGAEIDKFRVYVRNKDGVYLLESINCQESDQSVF